MVRRFVEEMVNTGDVTRMADVVSPDCVETDGLVRVASGVAGMAEHVRAVRAIYPDLHLTIERQIAEAGRAATRPTARGTHAREWAGHGADRSLDGLHRRQRRPGRRRPHRRAWRRRQHAPALPRSRRPRAGRLTSRLRARPLAITAVVAAGMPTRAGACAGVPRIDALRAPSFGWSRGSSFDLLAGERAARSVAHPGERRSSVARGRAESAGEEATPAARNRPFVRSVQLTFPDLCRVPACGGKPSS